MQIQGGQFNPRCDDSRAEQVVCICGKSGLDRHVGSNARGSDRCVVNGCEAVLRSALLSVAGGFGAFASIITDVRSIERTVLISIVNGDNDLAEVKILKK